MATAALPPDYCFPARLEEIEILEAARRASVIALRWRHQKGNQTPNHKRSANHQRCRGPARHVNGLAA